MDFNAKHIKPPVPNQTKKKSLSLEARHSKSIEASNKIRSKLRPRLFIPRPPSHNNKIILKGENSKNLKLRNIFEVDKERQPRQINRNEFKVKLTKNQKCDRKYKRTIANNKKNVRKRQKAAMMQNSEEHMESEGVNSVDSIELSTTKADVTVQEDSSSSWENLKIIVNENSTDSARYTTDGEIIFVDIPLELSSRNVLHEDDYRRVESNLAEIFKEPVVEEFIENLDTNSSSSTNQANATYNDFKQSKAESFKDSNKEEIEKYPKNPVAEKFVSSISELSTKSLDCPDLKKNILEAACEKTQAATSTEASKSAVANKLNSPRNKNSFRRHPLESSLSAATIAVADFQDTVRSSISLAHDCSPKAQKLNEDLINLENDLKNISKYLQQSYNDAEDEQQTTNNYLEYLRNKDIDRRKQRLHTSFLNQPNYTQRANDTLTGFLTVEDMSTNSSSPALNTTNVKRKSCEEAIIYKSNPNPVERKVDKMEGNLARRKYLQLGSCMRGTSSRNSFRVSTSTANSLALRITQNQTAPTSPTAAQVSDDNIQSSYSFSSLVCTPSQNDYNPCMASNSLGLPTTTKCSNRLTSQMSADNIPFMVANCNNYSLAAENFQDARLPLTETQTPSPHLQASCQNLNPAPNQMTNENLNQLKYQDFISTMRYFQNCYNCVPQSWAAVNSPAFEDLQMRNY